MYETMNELAVKMVAAARGQDWELLTGLESDCAHLARQIEESKTGAALSPIEHQRKLALIQNILAADAEVRRHTEPWMEQVRQFLHHDSYADSRDNSRQWSLQRFYGIAGPP